MAAAADMAEAGVGLVSHGAGAAPLPPLLRLAEARVPIALGNDNMRDTWGPYGTGDMLERAAIIGWRLVHAPVEDLLFGFAMVLLTLAVWVWLGRRGVQRTPVAGEGSRLLRWGRERLGQRGPGDR